MKQRKYTLPRHTNLAKQSTRSGAFLVDVAIFLALTVALLFGVFRFVFGSTLKPYQNELDQEKLNTHLFSQNESGEVVIISQDAKYEEYRDRISYYYLHYLTGDVEIEGTGSRLANEPIVKEDGTEVSKAEYFTISWFNQEILGISAENPDEDKDCLFTYVKNEDGTFNKNDFGVPKDPNKVTEDEILEYMAAVYQVVYLDDFTELSYIKDLQNNIAFIYSVEAVLSGLIAGVVTYVVFPLIFKQGRTVGKKIFKLALANSEGYEFNDHQLAMRIMPLVVVILSFLIPIWSDFFFLLIIPLVVFMVSFALAMASPKKAALHDFCARTIVVDDVTSIIFKDADEEERYLLKEDNIVVDEENNENEEGEEPEISYEK